MFYDKISCFGNFIIYNSIGPVREKMLKSQTAIKCGIEKLSSKMQKKWFNKKS